jgi:penicillin-binding protein 2
MLDEDSRAPGWRLGLLGLLVCVALAVLLTRLWNLQIVNSGAAVERSEAQTTVKARIAPARGAICDRNGVDLADNRPSFDIDFYLDDLERDYAKRNKGRVPRLQVESHKQYDASGQVMRDKWGNPVMTKAYSEIDIAEIVRQSIQPISQTLGLTAPLNDKEIRKHFREEADLPYHYVTDLDFATVAQFAERNFGVAGITIAQNPARQYPLGAFASHILGYVGRPVNQEEHVADDGTPFETVGLHGIEGIMDDSLQGEPGYRVQRVSSQGYYQGQPLAQNDPTMGNSVYLTIDARIQYIAETTFRDSGWTRGAVVVMDPRNGDVLALASFPNYDPNTFIPKIKSADWDKLNQDPTTPLYNRALHAFEPGSTYKIMVSLAGLKSGHVTANTEFDCPPAIFIGDHWFHNSDRAPGGTMALVNAIKVSSDVFFYQYGIKAGIDAIDAMGARAGFGHKWGLLGDADEDAGILPGPTWLKQRPEESRESWLRRIHNVDRWSTAQTANVSIGQGFVLCTPLQMATFLCAVANGGTVYQPRLYSKVVDFHGNEQPAPPAGLVYNTLDVKPAQLKAVQEGMYKVVEEEGGTGYLYARLPNGPNLAGKTGTAQAYRRVNGAKMQDLKTWFYCYGPFEDPRYVVCVLVEGGQWGGTAAAPIASTIMKRLFAMDAGNVENVVPLQPIQGNFKGVTDVETHSDDSPATVTPGASGAGADTGGDDNNPQPDAPPSPSARSSGHSRGGR